MKVGLTDFRKKLNYINISIFDMVIVSVCVISFLMGAADDNCMNERTCALVVHYFEIITNIFLTDSLLCR